MRKIMLLGDSGVGKSVLLHRFIYNEYNPNIKSQYGFEFQMKKIVNENNKDIIQVIDTTGQERFTNLYSCFLKNVDIILYIYDVNNTVSFNNVELWRKFSSKGKKQNIKEILVGNKINNNDVVQVVSYDDGLLLAQKHNMDFFEASSENGMNINEIFNVDTHSNYQKFTYNIFDDNKNDNINDKNDNKNDNINDNSNDNYNNYNKCNIL